MKSSIWKCAALDGQLMRVRADAWEVCHDDGKRGLCTAVFSGPFAEQRARRYYASLDKDFANVTGIAMFVDLSPKTDEIDLTELF